MTTILSGRKLAVALLLALFPVVGAWAGHLPAGASATINSFTEETYCAELLAGQTIPAGTVCYSVDLQSDTLQVTYATTGDWVLMDTHLWVGADATAYPQTKKGSPQPGKFPYKSGALGNVTEYSVQIDLTGADLAAWTSELACSETSTLFAMAHAVVGRVTDGSVGQTETAWSDGPRVLERGNWATETALDVRINCDVTPPPPPPEEGQTETAFAVFTLGESASVNVDRSACFLDLDGLGINRWGWSNALPQGSQTIAVLDIFAAAGQCDLGKGTHVGFLEVSTTADPGVLLVTYQAFEQFAFTEFHLYVGSEILPRDVNEEFTVAPGQYPIVSEVDGWVRSQSFLVDAPDGPLFLVAHSVVRFGPE